MRGLEFPNGLIQTVQLDRQAGCSIHFIFVAINVHASPHTLTAQATAGLCIAQAHRGCMTLYIPGNSVTQLVIFLNLDSGVIFFTENK